MEEYIMVLIKKNINLTNEELELIQGGADPYGKNLNGRYDWEIETVLTLPVHGFCPRGRDSKRVNALTLLLFKVE